MSTPGKIYALIPKIMEAIGVIGKDSKNTAQNYSFRGIEALYNGVHPALVKFGVFCCPQVVSREVTEGETKAGTTTYHVFLTVNHKFYADDGSFIEVITSGEGLDSSDKASNKAMSSALKYALIELFCIPTEDIADSDRESPEGGKTRASYQIKTVNTGKAFL